MSQTVASTAAGPVEYRLEGHGPTVMVLNGGHCSRHTRLSHEHLVEEGFSVLTPSRPGYDSTPSTVGRTAQEAADALAGLLDTLKLSRVDVIGISAAGPTALSFAQRHPGRVHKVVLESAVTLPWDPKTAKRSRLVFGRTEGITWTLMGMMIRVVPRMTIRMMISQLTRLDANEVTRRMTDDDLLFVRRMIETFRSGTGFLNDVEHRVDHLSDIRVPMLAMYSSNDGAVPAENSTRLASLIPGCRLFDTRADSHLIWIGKGKNEVWERRISFLRGGA